MFQKFPNIQNVFSVNDRDSENDAEFIFVRFTYGRSESPFSSFKTRCPAFTCFLMKSRNPSTLSNPDAIKRPV